MADKQQIEKVAALFVQQAPLAVAAVASGLSVTEIEGLIETEDFKKALASKQYEEHQRQVLIDKGWDGVEELAIASVVTHLTQNPDPDYALKAGMIANRAERRSKQNKTLEAPGAGQGHTIVIQMNQRFVNYVQDKNQMIQLNNRNDDPLPPKKQSNLLGPALVEKMLETPTEQEALEKRLGDGLGKITY